MHSRTYVKAPRIARAKITRPTPASAAASPPAETTPTDLVTIMGGARLYLDLGESQIRAWNQRGLLKFYANPDPRAGRRPGRGRQITRWVSVQELAAVAATMKEKASIAASRQEARDAKPPR